MHVLTLMYGSRSVSRIPVTKSAGHLGSRKPAPLTLYGRCVAELLEVYTSATDLY